MPNELTRDEAAVLRVIDGKNKNGLVRLCDEHKVNAPLLVSNRWIECDRKTRFTIWILTNAGRAALAAYEAKTL